MPENKVLRFEQQHGRLYIHFDVSAHSIRLDTFVETATRAQRILKALNHSFFQNDLKFDLIVVPPEPGSFLTRLEVYIFGGIGAIFGFANTDIGGAYIEGLTGETPEHIARQVGEDNREIIDSAREWLAGQGKKESPISETACIVGTKIAVDMTRGILELEKEKLDNLAAEPNALSEAIDARNEFYEACIKDRDVKGVGFTPKNHFPVPRNAFPERAVKTRRKEEEEEELQWRVATETLYVTSPNWDKEDQSNRHWKGKDSVRRSCLFVIDDDNFWANSRDLDVGTLDKIEVQWAFQTANGRDKNHRVLRVLKYNKKILAKLLSTRELELILGSYSNTVTKTEQGLLFD